MSANTWCDGCKDHTDANGQCFCNDVYVEVPR